MFFLKKLFGLRAKKMSKVPPDETDMIVCCPVCYSQKVALLTIEKETGKKTAQRSKQSGGCIFMESGLEKKICQDCAHVWDEKEFYETACVMMKPRK